MLFAPVNHFVKNGLIDLQERLMLNGKWGTQMATYIWDGDGFVHGFIPNILHHILDQDRALGNIFVGGYFDFVRAHEPNLWLARHDEEV